MTSRNDASILFRRNSADKIVPCQYGADTNCSPDEANKYLADPDQIMSDPLFPSISLFMADNPTPRFRMWRGWWRCCACVRPETPTSIAFSIADWSLSGRYD